MAKEGQLFRAASMLVLRRQQHCFLRYSISLEFVMNVVRSSRKPSHMRTWQSTMTTPSRRQTAFMSGISQRSEPAGFSMEKSLRSLRQWLAIPAQRLAISLPFRTLRESRVVMRLGDRPSGRLSDRSGCRLGAPSLNCHFGIGFSLAREYVPHGGASGTYLTCFCCASSHMICWPARVVQSAYKMGTVDLCLFLLQSTPPPFRPASQSAAAGPACPLFRVLCPSWFLTRTTRSSTLRASGLLFFRNGGGAFGAHTGLK